jgi:fibronectin-binding autotransporter adhesin
LKAEFRDRPIRSDHCKSFHLDKGLRRSFTVVRSARSVSRNIPGAEFKANWAPPYSDFLRGLAILERERASQGETIMNGSSGDTCVQTPESLFNRKIIKREIAKRKIGATSTPLLIATWLSALCLLAQPVFAQTSDVWLGGAGLWSSTSMWSTGQVPNSSNNVFIDNGKAGASPVTINYNGAQCGSLTINSDDGVTIVDPSIFTVYGPTIANAGTFSMNATTGAILDINGSVTLKGTGGLALSNNANNNIMGYGQASGATFTNQTTIRGSGNIGGNGLGSGNSFINQGTVNANQTTPLNIAVGAGTFKNTGTLEATNGATLALNGSGTVTNTLGIIHADTGSAVQLESGFSVTGGTLTTSGSGTIQANCCFNDGALNGVTINGTFQVNGSNIEFLSGTISDNGSVQLNSSGGGSAILDMQGAVTLKGTGTLTLSNSANNAIMGYGQSSPGASLTNQITIQGAGNIAGNGVPTGNSFVNQATVNANLPTPLTIAIGAGTITNTGILEATNGATLSLNGGGTLTNSGGTIHAGAGSVVSLASGVTISGGTLTTGGTGTIQANCCFNDGVLDGVTIGSSSVFQVNGSNIEYLNGTITNNGAFQVNSVPPSSAILDIKGSVTLKGSGTLTMSNSSNNAIMGYGQQGGAAFTNQSTIQGGGSIGPGSSSSFTNQHIVTANQTTPLIINGNFSNAGTLNVKTGSTMNITGGLFTNFTGGNTLTGGKYMVSGTLGFDNAKIGVNSANITLTGNAAQIVNDLNGTKALAHLYRNTSAGSISLQAGKILYIGGKLTNLGKVTVGAGSGLQLGALPLGGYIQTAGSTTVDGALSAPNGMNIQGGTLVGTGAIAAAVQSSGSVTAGNSTTSPGKLSINGSYTQNSTGALYISIGGLTVGTQYGQVAVTNGVSLGGDLNIALINGFVPNMGDVFVITTGSAISGKFATVNGLGINSGEHFAIAYNATNVTLTVVTGP